MNRWITFAITAIMICCYISLNAQITYYDFVDTVSIVSTRVEQPPTHTGRNITVIPAKVIASLPVLSADEILRYVPGVEVQQRGPMGAQSDILMRGSTFSQVLLLIDGMRLNDPLTAHFNGNIPIPASEIYRIEVLRGPAAALYGPDAVGGVINIITTTFHGESTSDFFNTQVEVLHGEYGLWNADAGMQIRKGNLRLGVGGKYLQTNGPILPSGLRNDMIWKQASISAGLNLGDKWYTALRSGIDYRLFNAQYFYTRSPADQSRERMRQFWNQLQLRRSNGKHITEINISHKITQDSFLFNPLFPANVHRTDYTNAQVTHHIKFSSQLNITTGIQVDRRKIESSDRGDHQDSHAGIFVMGYYQPLSPLGITASLRGDWDENYGSELTPQLNIAYTWNKYIFRGAVGKSIRAADFTERYISTEIPGPLSEGRNLGNPDLSAERAWSYELGIDWNPTHSWKLSTTGFLREGNNLIDYILTGTEQIPDNDKLIPGKTYFYTQNLKNIQTKGLEFESRVFLPILQGGQLELVGGYTYLYSRAPDGTLTKYIANHARHLLTFNSLIQYRRFSIGIQGLWKYRNPDQAPLVDENLLKSYDVWNFKMKLNIYQNQIHSILQINNIFNERYQDILGAQMPGRWAMAGIHWNLD